MRRRYFSDIAVIIRKPIDWKTFASIPFGAAWQLSGPVGGACALFGIRMTITRHNIAMMGRDDDLDTTRAKADLGWKTRVSYETAMERIADWIRQQGLGRGRMSYLRDKRILLTGAAGGFETIFVRRLPEKGAVLVVSAAIRRIEKRKRHVYPGFFAKAIWQLTRLRPIEGRQLVAD